MKKQNYLCGVCGRKMDPKGKNHVILIQSGGASKLVDLCGGHAETVLKAQDDFYKTIPYFFEHMDKFSREEL